MTPSHRGGLSSGLTQAFLPLQLDTRFILWGHSIERKQDGVGIDLLNQSGEGCFAGLRCLGGPRCGEVGCVGGEDS